MSSTTHSYSGNGGVLLLQRWHPATRIICGLALFLVLSLMPVTPRLMVASLLLIAAWLMLCRFGGRRLWQTVLMALLLFVPLGLYGWFCGLGWRAVGIVWRGVFCVLTSVATCSTIGAHETREAVSFLPRPLARLIVQLVVQSGLLAREARNIVNALRLRGGNMRVLFAFPIVWLTRLMFKAERVADAMEIRGME